MGYNVKVLADSVPDGCPGNTVRLTTLEITFPRIVLCEMNTHRMLSRSSASSRAIPVEKRIAAVEAEPFIPESFGKNQRGMQASEDLDGQDADLALDTWLCAADDAVRRARTLARAGVHKQLANRLLEPFAWTTVIISATEWSNFFALRCHPDAQPELRRAAEMMRDAMALSTPAPVAPGAWHAPLVPDRSELRAAGYDDNQIAAISVGRCARVSYLTHDGRRDPAADLALCARLEVDGHLSPFEHVAYPIDRRTCEWRADSRGFCGNLWGWVSYRKTLPYEDDFAMRRREV